MALNISKKILKIDLTAKRIQRESISPDIFRKYLGGKGLNSYLLLKQVTAGMSVYDPRVPLIFSNGLLTGSSAVSSSRIHLSSLSPLTGIIGSSNAGGYFGAELAHCGYLSIFITGQAENPVYIYIHGEDVRILDAGFLWGLGTHETERRLKEELEEDKFSTAVIGPAGEHRVAFASVIFPPHDAAGRTGLGAVMGAKNLKAIAVKSKDRYIDRCSAETKTAVQGHIKEMRKSSQFTEYSNWGDSTSVRWINELGAGSVRNFNAVTFEHVDTADGMYLKDLTTKRKSCFNCPVHCRAELTINRGRHSGFTGQRPDFEPMMSLGPRIGNENALETVYLHTLCNMWGVDAIEAGSCIGFAIELYKRGLLTKKETAGKDLEWGNTGTAEAVLKQIVYRDTWLGDILARGVKEASHLIKKGAEKYAYHVKGLSITAMDPRGFKATALGYAVGSRGADFTNVYARLEFDITPDHAEKIFGTKKAADRLSEEGKPLMVKKSIIAATLLDALGLCKISYLTILNDFELSTMTELVRIILDRDVTAEELSLCGERIVTAERLFNIRRGMHYIDDMLPEKFTGEAVKDGPCKGSKVNLVQMLKEYYALMGWDDRGVPKNEKLKELEL
ncbi:MAG: aldehyde ferredoxin oxidoreductase family protein [Spirochaetes bacterium]|nr:aldehyde ferredoxin oxidoreductase family protein [Spirochaetota bacterium]